MIDASLKKLQQSNFFFSKSWLIWGCAALFYGYQFMLRVSPGVMADDLMETFQVDACSLVTLTGFYYYAYAVLQIPVGTLMDRFKPRRMLTFAAIICGLGALVFSSADSLSTAAFGRTIIGAGSAGAGAALDATTRGLSTLCIEAEGVFDLICF